MFHTNFFYFLFFCLFLLFCLMFHFFVLSLTFPFHKVSFNKKTLFGLILRTFRWLDRYSSEFNPIIQKIWLKYTEAVTQRCSVKKLLLEILQNSRENTCARVSFLIKLQAALQLYQKRDSGTGVFPMNFAKFLRHLFLQSTSGWLLPKYKTRLIFTSDFSAYDFQMIKIR